MKKILLLALLSFCINAYILDLGKLEKEVNTVIFKDEQKQRMFWDNLWSADVAEWASENHADFVLGTLPTGVYNNPFPCLYVSPRIDGTQLFIDWLKKKYRNWRL